jgi:hypothetical protein
MVIALDKAGLPVRHRASDKSRQVIISPLAGVYVNVGLFPPIGVIPFLNHWYTGVDPPLVGVAVKVTELPAQQGLFDTVIRIETGAEGMTLIVMEFEVAGFPVAQLRLEVNTQVTTCPSTGFH